ncbi:efflux RND transporter permease subunit [Halobacillus sp. K22]|uniref:efflux RND transporter permease subunit n=1 Tax=Halobacillus sp. K22 TaxID=3457431 RepID=UPI003FCE4119
MKALQFIIRRKIMVGLLSVLIVLIGGYAVLHLDEELLPSFTVDMGYVNVYAGDQSAAEVERTITTPLEIQLKGVEGVKEVSSTTYAGQSSLQIEFEQGKGEDSIKEVEAVVNASKPDLPDVEKIESGQYGTTQSYQFFLDVSGGDLKEMTVFAKDILEPRLEELPEVRDVDLSGVLEQEVMIEFDREALDENRLDINQVTGVIQQANSESTLGDLNGETDSPSLRWNTTVEQLNDIKSIDIPTQDGFISLDKLASVSLQPKENSSFVWKNGTKDFIFAQIGGADGFTDIETAEAVRGELESIKEEGLTESFQVNEIVAQADYVKDSIDGVTSNILIGGAIAIAILLLFLRNIRATIIIGVSIPTSILLTMASIWILDYSLNLLTLIGLGLGIGMMVDSSIVILESIYRKKEQGLEQITAVLEGTREVATAVLASMLTTIVVFLPIGLLGGEMGQFMIVLSIVLAITLISSVIVSFTLIPALSERFLMHKRAKKSNKESSWIKGYGQMTAWIVRKKRYSAAVISLFILMFAGSLFLVTKIPMTIMPDMFNRYAEVIVDFESGLASEDKEELVQQMNDSLKNVQDVESNYIIDDGSMFYTIINMTKDKEITEDQELVNENIFRSLRDLQDTQPIQSVQSAMSGGGGFPVEVQIKGDSFEELNLLAKDFANELKDIDGLEGVTTSIDRTTKEEVVEVKENVVKNAGLTAEQLKLSIEQALLDTSIAEVTLDEEQVPVIARWQEEADTSQALMDWTIPTEDGNRKLSSFIVLTPFDTPNEISHVDGERFVSVSADIEGRDLGAVNRDVQKVIENFNTPAGYDLSAAGDLEQQQELIQEMILILGIAVFLVYLVMAVQFNHLFHPLIVMSVIPMTIVGVILGLFLTQRELSVMSGMGVVMLIGIVLNNAILYIDRTNQLRRQGYRVEESLIEAGKNRMRPIFMTSLTTAGGMLPLALATGSAGNYQAPMATVIISGLLFATVITLVLIPAVYRLFSKTERKEKMDMENPPFNKSAG